MAKNRRKRTRRVSEFEDDYPTESEDRRPRRRRWIRRRTWLMLIGLGLVASVIMAPMIATAPPVRDRVIAQLTADLPIQVDCGNVSLAWWSSVQLRDLRVHDTDDRLIASATEIKTDHSLLQLVRNPQSLGTIHVTAPTVTCYVRNGGSNLEDLLAQLPESEEDPAAIDAQVVIEEATIRIVDESQNVEHAIEGLNAELSVSESTSVQMRADGVVSSEQRRGQFVVSGRVESAEDSEPVPVVAKLQCEDLPMAVFDTLSRRLGIDLSVAGQASGQLEVDASNAQTITGELNVAELEVYTGMLPDEHFASPQASLKLDLIQSAGVLEVQQMVLALNLADATLRGKFDLRPGASWQSTLRHSEFQCSGQLDVAELARAMPRTLRLRDGIQMTDGLIQWDVSNQAEGDAYRLAGELQTKGMRAIKAGEQVDLTRPIDVQIQLRHSDEAFEVEQFVGRSTFAAFSGRGDTDQGQVALRADLNRLRDELSQFIDLRDVELAGELEGRVSWQAGADKAVLSTQGKLTGSDVRVTLGPSRQYREPNLDVRFQSQVQPRGSDARLISGSVEMAADDDRLSATINQPVRFSDTKWPLSIQVSGELANWRNRVRMIGLAELPAIRGTFDGTTELVASRDSVKFSDAKLRVEQLDLMLHDRRVQEPSIQLTCDGGWDGRANRMFATDAVLATTTFSIRAEQLEIPLYQPLEQARGQLNYRGDLAKLWQWSQPRGAVASQRPTGQVVGTLRIAQGQDGVQFVTSNDVRDFSWMELRSTNTSPRTPTADRRWTKVWSESKIRLLADGTVTNEGRDIVFRDLQAVSDAASLQLEGSLTDLTGRIGLRFRGRTRMDLDRLTPRLQPIWGKELRLQGVVDKPLVVEGSVRDGNSNLDLKTVSVNSRDASEWFPKDLNARGAIGWDRAYAFGFDIGQATVDARLGNRVLQIQQTELPVSGGTIRLAPRLQLRSPLRMTLSSGRVIDQVSITPQMCRGWLKFVAPLLADVTQAQGKFSMDLASANVPLTLPDRSRVDGKLVIHAARVGPGPTTQQLLTVIQQIKSIARPGSGRVMDDNWIQIPQQEVTYKMANRRISHDQMTMIVGGVPVRTQGWVALNQSMSLVAEVPIQEDWVQSNRWLANLKGQTLRIPIRGTLQNPRLNQNVLQNLSSGAVQNAAEGFLQNEMQRQFNRLFER